MHSFPLVPVLVFLSPLLKRVNYGIFKLTLQVQDSLTAFRPDVPLF